MEEEIEELLKRKDDYDFAYGTQIYRPYTMSKKDWELIENLLTRYKQLEEENKNCKKEYHSLINKIENKIDKFDYEFEKAKRKNDKDRADYYWDLIGNFIKLLREE